MEEHEPWATKPEDENVVLEIKSATFGWNEVGIFYHLISCIQGIHRVLYTIDKLIDKMYKFLMVVIVNDI
jgi:hypothetical protein